MIRKEIIQKVFMVRKENIYLLFYQPLHVWEEIAVGGLFLIYCNCCSGLKDKV